MGLAKKIRYGLSNQNRECPISVWALPDPRAPPGVPDAALASLQAAREALPASEPQKSLRGRQSGSH